MVISHKHTNLSPGKVLDAKLLNLITESNMLSDLLYIVHILTSYLCKFIFKKTARLEKLIRQISK